MNGGKVQRAILAEFAQHREPATLEMLTLTLSHREVVSRSRAGYESVRRAVAQLVERGLLRREMFSMSPGGRLVLIGLPDFEDAEFLESAPLSGGFTDLLMGREREEPPFSTNSDQEKRWAARTTNQEE